MSHFAVIREAGPAWSDGGIADQPAPNDHAAFMNGLAAEDLVLLAGPLDSTEHGRIRVLLIVSAESEAEIQRRLADDPWAISGHLNTASIEPWNVYVGAARLAEHRAAARTRVERLPVPPSTWARTEFSAPARTELE